MIAFYRCWFWFYLFIFVAGCASISGQGTTDSEARRDGYLTLVPRLTYQQSDVYYSYLTAQQYLRSNKTDKAIEAYSLALKQDPQSPFLMTEMATLYLRQGNTEKALEMAQQASKATPFYELAHMLLGGLYAGLGKP